jgi:hypothetical protein
VHAVGKGKVYAGQTRQRAECAEGGAGLRLHKAESDTRILFVHRKLPGGDIYFLDNRNDRDETVDASFRVTGKAPELWYAETGKSEPASYKIATDARLCRCILSPGARCLSCSARQRARHRSRCPPANETQAGGDWTAVAC